ncbi:MAG: hypothetical protein ACT6FG_08265, partial [Methanosarcinaceae archaeon]
GVLFLNITLGTAKTATGSGAGDPSLPQAPIVPTQDTTTTTTSTSDNTTAIASVSTSTEASSSENPQEKQIIGFGILPALAAIIACLMWTGRRGRIG